jgi:hypothetical protein
VLFQIVKPERITSSVAITTEIKKLLPEEGTKWLFMLATVKCDVNDRLDMDVVLVDADGFAISWGRPSLRSASWAGNQCSEVALYVDNEMRLG